MAVAIALSFVSGNTNGRINGPADTIKVALTGGTAGTWYDLAIAKPDGIGGVRVQAAADGTATYTFVPMMAGAFIVTAYPTSWTVGSVPQPGPTQAQISTTGFNMVAVTPDVGMAFPTATVSAVTLASANVST